MPGKTTLDEEKLRRRFFDIIFRDGYFIKKLSQEFGVSGQVIQRRLRKMGLRYKDILYDPEQSFNKRLIEMHKTMGCTLLGRHLKLCRETIRKRLTRMGIEPHDQSFKHFNHVECPNLPGLTGEEVNELIKKEYEKYKSVAKVKNKLGLADLATVRKRLHSMGIETNHRKWVNKEYEPRKTKVMALWEDGHSMRYIAWKLGISVVSVKNWLNRGEVQRDSQRYVSIFEHAEMSPENSRVRFMKRLYYWNHKGYRQADIARLENVSIGKIQNGFDLIGIKYTPDKYTTHQASTVSWMIQNRASYLIKTDKQIATLERESRLKGVLRSGLHPRLSIIQFSKARNVPQDDPETEELVSKALGILEVMTC